MALAPVTALVTVICRPPCNETFTDDAYVRGSEAQVWIEANLSDVQLMHVRIGQPATVVAQIYGERLTFEGKVAGHAPGGLRIEQRPPVRIELEPRQPAEHLLRDGLPIRVNIDTSDRTGATLVAVAGAGPS